MVVVDVGALKADIRGVKAVATAGIQVQEL